MSFEVPEGWNLAQSPQGDLLVRVFDRGDFVGAVSFVDSMVPVAEGMGHHPDLQISWKDVTVSLFTHSEGRVTEKDFELARAINDLA
ncbi:MAG: 4a-hydroxytetrahydrobiopterin dehydratase [Solirubrobacterales bacterium]